MHPPSTALVLSAAALALSASVSASAAPAAVIAHPDPADPAQPQPTRASDTSDWSDGTAPFRRAAPVASDRARCVPAPAPARCDPSVRHKPAYARAEDGTGGSGPFDRAESGSDSEESGSGGEHGKWVTVADGYDGGGPSRPQPTSASVSTPKSKRAEDTPDWQGGGIQWRRAVPNSGSENEDANANENRQRATTARCDPGDSDWAGGLADACGGATDRDSGAAPISRTEESHSENDCAGAAVERESDWSGGIVYRDGGAIDHDGSAASGCAVGVRWVPGDDASGALETA
ncbi:hypothetical protein EIP86_006071 [Pleurotus ostreatoroseus]|nr:hypothetical protein EIP86_006071 [Pleurotus ostreatoroseus]